MTPDVANGIATPFLASGIIGAVCAPAAKDALIREPGCSIDPYSPGMKGSAEDD